MLEFNPFAWDLHEDPYPTYRRLRDEAPLYHNDRLGFWALSRYDDVLAGFKDSEHLSNADGVSLERSSHAHPSETASFLAMDPPRHDRMRGLVVRGFTPKRVADLAPRVRTIATAHIDGFVARGRCAAHGASESIGSISCGAGAPPSPGRPHSHCQAGRRDARRAAWDR